MREEKEGGEKGRRWSVRYRGRDGGMEGATEGMLGGLREVGGIEGGVKDQGRDGRAEGRTRGIEGRRDGGKGEGGRHKAQCHAWLCT